MNDNSAWNNDACYARKTLASPGSGIALLLTVLLSLLLGACGGDSDEPAVGASLPPLVSINMQLSGEQTLPPVSVAGARGTAALTLNTSTGALSGSVQVAGLSGPATMVYLQQGFAGSEGERQIELLSNSDGSEWFLPAGLKLNAQQLAAAAAGEYYINVYTSANAEGELRGQIVFGDVVLIRSSLSGEKMVPAVSSSGSAQAVTTVDTRSGRFNGAVFISDSTAVTSVAVHLGLEGVNGVKKIDLSADASDNAVWRTPAEAALDVDALAALEMQGLYYEVSTAQYSSGELRGQIAADAVEGAVGFTVTIENVSTELTLPTSNGSAAVPLSPGAYIVHRQPHNPLIQPLQSASDALEALAEDGDPMLFPDAFPGSIIFDTPLGGIQPGPIYSGDSYQFSFSASAGDKLSLVTKFVESSDWFYTTTDEDNSISLFDSDGNPRSGDVSELITLWESGTEVDQTPGEGSEQNALQEASGVASLQDRGTQPMLNGQVIRVTLTLD